MMRGVELANGDIYGEIMNVTVNGVGIGPLVNAELDRRIAGPSHRAGRRTRLAAAGPAVIRPPARITSAAEQSMSARQGSAR